MYRLLFLLSVIIFASCNHATQTNAPAESFNLDSAKAHILKMNESYSQRFTSNDSMFYVNRYCVDAAVYSPNMPAVLGRDSIRSFFYNGGQNTEAKIELPAGQIYGNKDLVLEEGSYNFPDGKGGSFDKGKFIAIWKMEDGVWKLYREIWNSDLLPPKQ